MTQWIIGVKFAKIRCLFTINSRSLCIVDLFFGRGGKCILDLCNLRIFIFGPFTFDILLHFYAINTSMLIETKCKRKECVLLVAISKKRL